MLTMGQKNHHIIRMFFLFATKIRTLIVIYIIKFEITINGMSLVTIAKLHELPFELLPRLPPDLALCNYSQKSIMDTPGKEISLH